MLLSARKLCRSFSDNQVLFEVDLDLQAGEVYARLGENGVGKSTLVNTLARYLRPTSGDAFVDGHN